MSGRLRFHWRLIQGGDLGGGIAPERLGPEVARPELPAQTAFCREAEKSGIDSVLVDFGRSKPDSMVLAMALATRTERLKFMVAHRPGLISPTLFVQQVNTFSMLAEGRISLNIVAGYSPAEQLTYGDAATHDERYERLREYLEVCARLWSAESPANMTGRFYQIESRERPVPFIARDRRAPEIYVGGSSRGALEAACALGDCWLRFGETPERIAPEAATVRQQGAEVGLRLACIVRPTRREAVDFGLRLLEGPSAALRRQSEAAFVQASDAVSMRQAHDLGAAEWLTPRLWAGAVRALGATCLALVGTPEEVADEIWNFREAGVSQFILHGWPKWEEMRVFCRDVLPLVRRREARSDAAAQAFNAGASP